MKDPFSPWWWIDDSDSGDQDVKKLISDSSGDSLHSQRQVNKNEVGPAVLMEIFGKMTTVGNLKGYKENGWWLTKPRYTYTGLLKSAKRHMIEIEKGKQGETLDYTEHNPKTNEPIQSNHAYALFWNAAVLALYQYFNIKDVDDRWLHPEDTND